MSSTGLAQLLTRRYREYFESRPAVPFAVRPLGEEQLAFGSGEPTFTFTVQDRRGERALASLDQFRVAVAYLKGWLDLDGDMMTALSMRDFFKDFHPIAWLGRFVPLVGRGIAQDSKNISSHYDRETEFFLTFLDNRHRCYTQGVFATDDEPLEDAMTRKMDVAIDMLGVQPGDHVLEVGGGWGAFMEYAAKRGIRVTSLTLAQESEKYLQDMIDDQGLQARVVREHLLKYRSDEKYDAIVNMGTTEHLPNYKATLKKYAELLRPGGKVYLDSLAMTGKFHVSTFMGRYIYPGQSSPLLLHQYLRNVAKSPFRLLEVYDERHDYYLTCKAWAERLDAEKDQIVARWGEGLYRQFRLFLWASATSFDTGKVQAYRWCLQLPAR
jgi:cyclopropane-fatty-acyl-phospholipid synthase